MSYKQWLMGDHAPYFFVRATNNPRFAFHSVAGRYIVLSFMGDAAATDLQAAHQHITKHTGFFNDEIASFFGISTNQEDESSGRVQQADFGIRYFWDFDQTVSRLYGALPENTDGAYRPFTLILDPMLRVISIIPMDDVDRHNQLFDQMIAALPSIQHHAGVPLLAPVLILPRVFEPDFCKALIELYQQNGGEQSGFMREIDGKTVGILDDKFKRRKDFTFDSQPELENIRNAIRARINRRLVPAIHKAFQFSVTRMERYIVACYDSQSQGFFRPHRDNTTKGTAHRQFACTINLNAEAFEGGNLRFPEFGEKTYKAPTGGAVVFSCSLLHEATPVTKGTRYAFLPFLYNEDSAKIRQQNKEYLTGEVFDKNETTN